MTTTVRVTGISSAGWTELANGSSNVTVDLDQILPNVKLRVDTSLPGVGVHDGFLLSAQRRTFSLAFLGAGDKVYARSTGGTVSLVVMTTDTSSLETLVGSTNTRIGATNDAAAASDTAVSSFIGLFKRLLQKLTAGISVFLPTSKIVKVAQTVTASSAYASGNCIGGKITFTGIVRANDITGFLQQVAVNCKSAQTGAVDLVIFNADPSSSTISDKTNLSVAAADFDKVVDVIHITDWTSLGTPSIGKANNLGIPFQPATNTTTIYAALVARSTPTFSSTSDVSVTARAVSD